MNNNLICISKKTFYLLTILFLIITFILALSVNNNKLSYQAKANIEAFSCTGIGKYDISNSTLKNVWTQDCEQKYGQQPAWNGSYGIFAKCYLATARCANASDCNQFNCLTGCLYQQVPMDTCVQYGKAPKNWQYTCKYANQTVTDKTTPYQYISTPVNSTTYLCIEDQSGNNIGAKCKTDSAGNIVADGSYIDKTNCPLPSPTVAPVVCHLGGQIVKFANESYKTKGTYYMPRLSYLNGTLPNAPSQTEATVIATSYRVMQYVNGTDSYQMNKDIYTGYVCRPVFDNSGKQDIKNVVSYTVGSEIRNDINGNGNYFYCTAQRAVCGPFNINGKQQTIAFGQNFLNSTFICGCDVAGKYRYSTLIAPTPTP